MTAWATSPGGREDGDVDPLATDIVVHFSSRAHLNAIDGAGDDSGIGIECGAEVKALRGEAGVRDDGASQAADGRRE